MATKLDKSDIATIIAALRAFQEQYEDCDASEIYEDWEEDFTDENGDRIEPLGSNDINTPCKGLSSGTVQLTTLPIDGHKFIVNTANGFFSGREYFPEEEK